MDLNSTACIWDICSALWSRYPIWKLYVTCFFLCNKYMCSSSILTPPSPKSIDSSNNKMAEPTWLNLFHLYSDSPKKWSQMNYNYRKEACNITLKNISWRTCSKAAKPVRGQRWAKTIFHLKVKFWISVIERNLILVYYLAKIIVSLVLSLDTFR